MNDKNIKESKIEQKAPTILTWIRKQISSTQDFQYELAFDTSKPFHYKVG